ncbi:polyprenyl synthetase family protein [Candidatus Gottesmanbacteria bacterium]|nr:polyprenyl synthetase family protein [Candidatus Gottesmanbacteria bacterium]
MDFSPALHDVKTTVDKELKNFFLKKRDEARSIHPQTLPLVDEVTDFTLRGGKRTRPFLVWLGFQAVIARSESASDVAILKKHEIASPSELARNDTLMSAMMAIELFESFALIHDDIIDEDAVRRRGPTIHEKFKVESLKFKVKNAQHFGESMGILAGDLALVLADELMEKIVRHSGLRARLAAKRARDDRRVQFKNVFNIYQKMKEEVIYGQSLDVLAAAGLPSADQATINAYKTAWYTVIRPLQIGAAIAGADKKALDVFVLYGLAVGEGYQLRDDFLDGEISDGEFQDQSSALERQAVQAVGAIQASMSVVSLFTDFAHFALHRQS